MKIETKIYTYNEVYTSHITLYADGNVKISDTYAHHVIGTINKMACINVSNDWDLASLLAQATSPGAISPGSSLYVASECKTGRDTFRNSGYSITRNQEKADAVVVPDVIARNYYTLEYNMVAFKPEKNELHLFYVEKPGYMISQLVVNDLVSIRTHLKNNGYEPLEVDREKIKIWFIPKCDEIRAILESNEIQNKPYIQESKVQIKASTQISPETLVFWENIDDMNLLRRTICTSDWMDYPVTLCAFLCCSTKYGSEWFKDANNDFRRILKNIGYETYWNLDCIFSKERVISPKDYEMLQSYIYYKFGINEKGGLVSSKTFSQIPSVIRRFMQQRIALKPMSIPVKMKLGDIENIALS